MQYRTQSVTTPPSQNAQQRAILAQLTSSSLAGSRLRVRAGPSGLHFFDRITGFNLLLDEVRVTPSQWAMAPRQISIALTNACDLSCHYCYASKVPASLNDETVVAWLDELDANGCLGVGFGGGEPTLYRRFPDLCRHATKHTGLAVSFTSHAHRIDERLAGELAGNVHFIRVSMDGIGTTYEALRGKSFDSLCHHLKTVRALAKFGINFVVNRQTITDLEAAANLATEAGACEFLLLPERPSQSSMGIDGATMQALRAWVRGYCAKIPLTISETGAEGFPTSDPFSHERGLRAYAHISATGNLMRTSYDGEGVKICETGVMRSLAELRKQSEDPR
jgi:sulfatase maturation enzyme AslB (radical SAM superfamily)